MSRRLTGFPSRVRGTRRAHEVIDIDVPFERAVRGQTAQTQAKAQGFGVFATCQGDFHSEQ
jgi:hypothetical protein